MEAFCDRVQPSLQLAEDPTKSRSDNGEPVDTLLALGDISGQFNGTTRVHPTSAADACSISTDDSALCEMVNLPSPKPTPSMTHTLKDKRRHPVQPL
ncbi:hypothetical protein D915_008562 [Fasciola hepatica]|uniref:Uncharacterized protein n=1 Tax=Fasciola hepatica TaxID=6192 RepID=A0A2H1BZ31_FASHE|nr:hypothetical protein D915_008562 [Fasciola hepatica]